MSDDTYPLLIRLISRIECFFTGHQWIPDRAIEREEGGYKRVYPNDDREPDEIDACTVVDVCTHCHAERKIYASVEMANRYDIELQWDTKDD